jgi:hypothetical protein
MQRSITSRGHRDFSLFRHLAVALALACILALGGCGGTKVYTIDKTVVYNGNVYNMGNVQRVGSRIEGRTDDGTTIDMTNMDKKAVEGVLEENGELMVTMAVMMDETEMVYMRTRVDRYSDYNKMKKRFDGALNDISKFMANKKKTQLKLK